MLIFVDTEIEESDNGETVWSLDDLIVARVDAKGIAWRQRLLNRSGDPKRDLFLTDRLAVLRERDGVEAIDLATGRVAWSVRDDALESVLNDPQFWQAKLDGDALWVGGRFALMPASGVRAFELEIDLATGKRVHRRTKPSTPPPVPLYVRPPFRLEYPGDKAPPEVPVDFDGLRVRRTALAWSTKTGEGVIVGPLASDAAAVLDAARSAKAGGKPVTWRYVIDLPAVGAASPALPEQVAGGDPIVIAPSGDLEGTAEWIDAASVAKALGAQAITGAVAAPLQTKAGPITLYRRPPDSRFVMSDPQNEVHMRFGPYVFVDAHVPSYRLADAPW